MSARVVGVAKDDRSERVVFTGTVEAAEDYVERNTSPDNYERYRIETEETIMETTRTPSDHDVVAAGLPAWDYNLSTWANEAARFGYHEAVARLAAAERAEKPQPTPEVKS